MVFDLSKGSVQIESATVVHRTYTSRKEAANVEKKPLFLYFNQEGRPLEWFVDRGPKRDVQNADLGFELHSDCRIWLQMLGPDMKY